MNHRILTLAAAAAAAAGAAARPPMATTRLAPTSQGSGSTSKPAPEKVDPAAMKILKRLEAAGEKYPQLQADLEYRVDLLQLGDREERTGKVYYQAAAGDEPAKFRIHFDTLTQGGIKTKRVVDYVYDGAWLTVRKERIKQMIRYQVTEPGQKAQPLELGKGPFPVPFGQKAETVLAHFAVSTRQAKDSDPANTDYLKLVTRPAHRRDLNVVWMEMWVRRDTGLPIRIVTEDQSENRTTVVFKNITTPKQFDRKTFEMPRPPRDWEYRVEKFEGSVK